MNPLFLLRLFQRPWQWLLLLLVGSPFAWAAGVSINNVVISNVKQLSFAQAKAEVDVTQRFTQAATARLSPGGITYRSKHPTVATVNAQTGEVTGMLAGEATIVADQAASPPYPPASASYTIRVKGQPVSFDPWQLASVMYGMPAFQITPPTSAVQGGSITYSLKDPGTTVAGVTKDGLVTVKAVGKTTIVATRGAFGVYDPSSVEAELEVTAVPGLNDREIGYTTVPIDLLPQLGGQAVTYTSTTPGVASIIGTGAQPQVSLKGLGTTVLEATNAAGTVLAKAQWKVVPGLPTLSVDPVSPLASTTFETTLRASTNSGGQISFSIPNANQVEWIAHINPTTGQLWVKGPGTVNVRVSVAASGPWAQRDIMTSVTILDGPPGIELTSWPTETLKRGDIIEVGYRTNFTAGYVTGVVTRGNAPYPYQYISLLSQTARTPGGANGNFRFLITDEAEGGQYQFIVLAVESLFSVSTQTAWLDPALVREFTVDVPPEPNRYKLGPPTTQVYGTKPVMPQTFDMNGTEMTGDGRCVSFISSNTAVLRGVGLPDGGIGFDADSWEFAGVGETTITCFHAWGNPPYVGHNPVVMTVIGADPQLQAFPDVEIGIESLPYPQVQPGSLNTNGAWRYEIVQLPGEPVVATIANGNEIVPLAPGKARLRASQLASNNYREASIEADLTVNGPQPKSFETIYATYGDPDFDIPRPEGVDSSVALSYQFEQASQDVATIVNGRIRILNAGEVNIEARYGPNVITGKLIVRKAKPRLAFYFPPGLYFSAVCGEEWIWPIANQGTNNRVGGTLTTNSDGALYYPMGVEPNNAGNTGPNQNHPYYLRVMGHAAYTPEMAVWQDAWVEQAASRNFEAARSASIRYAIWGNDTVRWFESLQQWVTSCNQ